MTRIKQAGPPILVVALIAGLIGYIIGCTQGQREQDSQVRAQETISSNDDNQSVDELAINSPSRAVAKRSPTGTAAWPPIGLSKMIRISLGQSR